MVEGGRGCSGGIVPELEPISKDRSICAAFAGDKKCTCDWDLMLDGISHLYAFQKVPGAPEDRGPFGAVWQISADQSTLMQPLEINAIKVRTHSLTLKMSKAARQGAATRRPFQALSARIRAAAALHGPVMDCNSSVICSLAEVCQSNNSTNLKEKANQTGLKAADTLYCSSKASNCRPLVSRPRCLKPIPGFSSNSTTVLL